MLLSTPRSLSAPLTPASTPLRLWQKHPRPPPPLLSLTSAPRVYVSLTVDTYQLPPPSLVPWWLLLTECTSNPRSDVCWKHDPLSRRCAERCDPWTPGDEALLTRGLDSGPHSETQGQGWTVWSSACFKPKTYPTSGIFICDNNNRHVLKTVIVAMQAGFGSREDCDFSFLTESSALCECFYGGIFCTGCLSRVLQSYVKQMICFKVET